VTYWLMVERLENWEVDRREGFRRFGLPDRLGDRGNEIKKADLLIFYVSSGISCFADIREATEDGTHKLRLGGDYDTAFPIYLASKPLLTLPRAKWVRLHGLVDKLSFTRGKRDWRQAVRSSLRRLTDDDGRLLVDVMTQTQQKHPQPLTSA
jgi:hypothetical protein